MIGRIVSVLLAASMLLGGGCGTESQQPSPSPGPASPFVRPAAQSVSSADKFTILLFSASGMGHAEQVIYYKEQTAKHTGWEGLFVVHEDEGSALYWGVYGSSAEAGGNLKKAKAYRAPAGVQPFVNAFVVPLPGKDPGPPEWNLSRAKGAYTVLVAVYYDDHERKYVGRKSFAVECCRQLRQEGFEAFYYHGPARSHVTIGDFPEQAIEMVQDEAAIRPEIKDPQMLAILQRFPQLSVNGAGIRSMPYTLIRGEGMAALPEAERVKYDVKTAPVRIPKDKDSQSGDPFGSFGHSQPR